MLWFNRLHSHQVISYSEISIHLMLWFNGELCALQENSIEFQYILCCGSTKSQKRKKLFLIYFNTSYVVVQLNLSNWRKETTNDFNTSYVVVQLEKKWIKDWGKKISIHLMLWFNFFGCSCWY